MSVADLAQRHPTIWARATRHAFLDAVRDGVITESAFNRWLAQDYRFVADLLWFQARLLARAPRPPQAVLASGVAALVEELSWFERQAQARGLDLAVPELPATAQYRRLLEQLDEADFPVALASLWTIERVYLEAWTHAAPGAPAFREYVEHWTVPQFVAYVTGLEAAADDALRQVDQPHDVDAYFRQVVEAEVSFWDMAWAPQA